MTTTRNGSRLRQFLQHLLARLHRLVRVSIKGVDPLWMVNANHTMKDISQKHDFPPRRGDHKRRVTWSMAWCCLHKHIRRKRLPQCTLPIDFVSCPTHMIKMEMGVKDRINIVGRKSCLLQALQEFTTTHRELELISIDRARPHAGINKKRL